MIVVCVLGGVIIVDGELGGDLVLVLGWLWFIKFMVCLVVF